MERLCDLLGIGKGVTALVGGGGKTSTIYQLAKELSGKGNRVIVTTTTKMYLPKSMEVQHLLLEPTVCQMKDALLNYHCIGIGSAAVDGKMVGVTSGLITEMKRLADYVLVEADGAKHLPIKVPSAHEPVIPKEADQVVAVVGLSGLGQTVAQCCFRKENVMALLGVNEGHRLEVEDIVEIITSLDGLRKGVDDLAFSILLNQVDALEDERLGKSMARQIIRHKIQPVIIASLQEKRWWQGNT